MRIGVPREVKPNEDRVALTPAGVHALVRAGHTVVVEQGAGVGSGFDDDGYRDAGAKVVPDAARVWETADLVVKVKEPVPDEWAFFRPGLTLFTYLHLAASEDLTRALTEGGITAIAYETVQLDDGSLPLLTPMSEVAGRMAPQVGAHLLEKAQGGRGVLLGGVPGVPPADVVIIGGGTVGRNAARIALGLGARVTVLDIRPEVLRWFDDTYGGRITTLMSNEYNIAQAVRRADLLIGAVLIPGARAPRLVHESAVRSMKPGAVIIDVAVDQGGSIATIERPTTHDEPTYERFGVLHYAVANMPAAVPRTSTLALTNATLQYVLRLAERSVDAALRDDPALRRGVNTYRGHLTHQAVATAHRLPHVPLGELLG